MRGCRYRYVRDATWEDLVLYGVQESITIDMFYDHGKNETTHFDISNITVRSARRPFARPSHLTAPLSHHRSAI